AIGKTLSPETRVSATFVRRVVPTGVECPGRGVLHLLGVLGGLLRELARRRSGPAVAVLAVGNGALRPRLRCVLLRLGRARDGGERAGLRAARLQVAELALQVDLQAAAVLALERAQVVDLALELLALLHERPHDLAVPLLGVAVEGLGAGARLADDLVGLAACLAEYLLGLAAGAAERLVGLAAGVGDRLVGGLLREREDAGSGVHVVLAAGRAGHAEAAEGGLRLGLRLRLGPRRLGDLL